MACGFEAAGTELWYKVEPPEQETERCPNASPFKTYPELFFRSV